MAELIIKEVSRSGDNVTYGVFFNPIEYGTVVDLDSFQFVFNFPVSDFTYVSHEEGAVGTKVSNASNVGIGQFNFASFSFPTTEFDTEASVLLVTVDASKSTGPVQLSISDIVLNSAEIPGINATVIANEHENTLPTGSVLISGSAVEDQLLNATNDLSDVDGLGDVSYQWFSDAEVISGATSATYTLTQSEVGKKITVTASYTDEQGTAESVTSSETEAVANVNDDPTGSVVITGTAAEDQTLTASNTLADEDGLGEISYQWSADGEAISGATSATYTLTQSEVGKKITVTASYTDEQGTAESVTSSETEAVANVNDAPTGSVVITGTAAEDQTLTASNTLADEDGLGEISYQWSADGEAISGATSATYTLTQSEVGKKITVTASYTDEQGTAESETSAETEIVTNVNDEPVGSITISGSPNRGATLTAVVDLSDEDGLGEFAYQWYADGVEIANATGENYALTAAEVGKVITASVSYTDGEGQVETETSAATLEIINTNSTGSIQIEGSPVEDGVLNINDTVEDPDGISEGAKTYQWYANGDKIADGSETSITLTQDHVGKAISASVSYIDGSGTQEVISSGPTQAVLNVNDAPTGSVVITGTAAEDQTLTASNTLADEDGLGEISYQWSADGEAISGATSATYTLTQSEVGKKITVTASYTDEQGTAESVTSSETEAVANVNDAPTGSVVITGTAAEDQTLTASNTLADEDGLGEISYQWSADGEAISGATSATYTLTQSEVGKKITVTASYTDEQGTAESETSAETEIVTNVNDEPVGSITISGSPNRGATLTAVVDLSDEDGLGEFAYQWYADGVEIANATGENYALTAAEVGKVITASVSYTDGEGQVETETSAATLEIINTNSTGSIQIEGSPVEDGVLNINDTVEDPDGISEGAKTYQWYANGDKIADGSETSITLTQDHVGKAISASVSYIDGSGTQEVISSGPTQAVLNVNDAPTGSVVITGTAAEDQTLTASNTLADEDGLGEISYQWSADGEAISGATSATYTLTQSEVGKKITVTASYTDEQGTAESVTSSETEAVANVNDAPTGSVVITGTAAEDQTLTASNTLADEDGLGEISYQWSADGEAISGATSATYTLTQSEVGKKITVTASYTDEQGTAESETSAETEIVTNVNDEPTGSVTIGGTPEEGAVLNIVENTISDEDGLGKFSYQWLRDGKEIALANEETYKLKQFDIGSDISVRLTYTDDFDAVESVESSTISDIQNVNDAPIGAVTITGKRVEDGQLIANTRSLRDEDGLGEFEYQWLRGGLEITGATELKYTLVDEDVGEAISVRVTYTDGFGTTETVTSVATSAIQNVNDDATGSVEIVGALEEGGTLTVNTDAVSDLDGLTSPEFSHNWYVDGILKSQANEFVLTQEEVGKSIQVSVNFKDDTGAEETITSEASEPVGNVNDAMTGTVVISGTASEGETLSADTSALRDDDGLTNAEYTYQWYADNTAIEGATASTFNLTETQVGAKISVQVSTFDDFDSPEVAVSAKTLPVTNTNNPASGSVLITGEPIEGETLTIDHAKLVDGDGLEGATFNYQWYRDGTKIDGETADSYEVQASDNQTLLSATVTYIDDNGTQETVKSTDTSPALAINFIGTTGNEAFVGNDLDNKILPNGGIDTAILGDGTDTVTISDAVGGLLTITDASGTNKLIIENYVPDGSSSFTLNDGVLKRTSENGYSLISQAGQVFSDITLKSGENTATLKVLSDSNAYLEAAGNKLFIGSNSNDLVMATSTELDSYSEVHLGDGDDTADIRGDGQQIIYAGDGHDYIAGAGSGSDLSANVIAFLGQGDDYFFQQAGDLEVDGGKGDDLFFLQNYDGTSEFKSLVDAGSGNDTIDTSYIGNANINGGEGYDTLRLTINEHFDPSEITVIDLVEGSLEHGNQIGSISGIEGLEYTGPALNFTGGDEANFVDINLSWDIRSVTFVGGAGKDTLLSVARNVTIDAGDDNDFISLNWIDDRAGNFEAINTIDGGDGRDVVELGNFYSSFADLSETLYQDLVFDALNDTITLTKNGVDFVFSNVEGFKVNAEFISEKMIELGTSNASDNVDKSASVDDEELEAGGGDDTVTSGSGDDTVDSGSGDDTVIAGAGDDLIINALGNDTINGGEGADTGVALSGNNSFEEADELTAEDDYTIDDTYIGGFGSDSFFAGGGNDIIIGEKSSSKFGSGDEITGGTGDDLLQGGLGSDVFVFRSGDGRDTIAEIDVASMRTADLIFDVLMNGPDFQVGVDKIKLSGFEFTNAEQLFAQLDDPTSLVSMETNDLGDTVLTLGDDSITLVGIDHTSLTQDDFIF